MNLFHTRLTLSLLTAALLVSSLPAQAVTKLSDVMGQTGARALVGTTTAVLLAGIYQLNFQKKAPLPRLPKDDSWLEYFKYLWKEKFVGMLATTDRTDYTYTVPVADLPPEKAEKIPESVTHVIKHEYSKIEARGFLGSLASHGNALVATIAVILVAAKFADKESDIGKAATRLWNFMCA